MNLSDMPAGVWFRSDEPLDTLMRAAGERNLALVTTSQRFYAFVDDEDEDELGLRRLPKPPTEESA